FFHVALIQTSILPCLGVGYPQAAAVASLSSGRNCLTRQRKLAEMMGFSEFCLSEGSFFVRRGPPPPSCAPGHALAGNPSGRSLLTLFFLWIVHETHLPTFRYPPQSYPRLSRAHENPWRPRRAERPSRQRPQAPGRVRPAPGLSAFRVSPHRSFMPRATLPPEARLHRPSEFAAALKGRRLARGAFFILSAAPSSPPPGQAAQARLGMVIAKRYAAHASTRNALKRVIR